MVNSDIQAKPSFLIKHLIMNYLILCYFKKILVKTKGSRGLRQVRMALMDWATHVLQRYLQKDAIE